MNDLTIPEALVRLFTGMLIGIPIGAPIGFLIAWLTRPRPASKNDETLP